MIKEQQDMLEKDMAPFGRRGKGKEYPLEEKGQEEGRRRTKGLREKNTTGEKRKETELDQILI